MKLHKNLFLLIFFAGAFLSAQVTFKAIPDKNTAKVGERIQLRFIITTGQDSEFEYITFPSFSGFQMLGRSLVQNINYTNGRMTKQFMETVVLMPKKTGKYTINGGFVVVDGKKYQSNPVTFTITQPTPKARIQDDHLVFMEVVLDKNQVYPNESIHAEIKLYAKSYDALRRRTDLEIPGMSDFQVREISKNQDRDFEQELINNQVYISERIAQYQLTPKNTGDLVIPAFTLRVAIPLDFYEEKIVEVKTNHRTVYVNDFPPNAPLSFTGAVGDFRFATHLDKKNVSTNESINYEVELIGEGNFSSIILPKLKTPRNLEVYPSKSRNSFKSTNTGEKGKLVDRYVMVPQYGGSFTIPSLEFCYFNPKTEKYVTISTDTEELEVKGKAKDEAVALTNLDEVNDSLNSDSSKSRTSIITKIPREITEIFKKPRQDSSVESGESDGMSWWYAGLSIPILAGLLWFFVYRNQNDKTEDSQQINKLVYKQKVINDLKELKTAKQDNNRSTFLKKSQEMLNDIICYYSDEQKYYDVVEARAILRRQTSERFAQGWESLYNNIQSMSYGMAVEDMDLQGKYNHLEDLIKESLKN